jgi:hypothetical protein
MCDPLNSDGVAKFFAQGPQLPSLIRSPWTYINLPVTYWTPAFTPNTFSQFKLTGLGVALGISPLPLMGVQP